MRREGLVFDVTTAGRPGGRPVVLLHGFPQSARCWDAVTPALTGAGCRTHAPDQRGYSPGARPVGRGAYRMSSLVADALAVVDEARAEAGGAPVHLVGHDWGALVAWRLAARYPDHLATLTALSVPPPAAFARAALNPGQALASWYVLAFQLPWLPEWSLGAGRGERFSERFVRSLTASGLSRAAAERDAAFLAGPGALTAALNWYRAIPLDLLPFDGGGPVDPPVRVPTLFVWSDGDVAVTRAAADRAGDHVSGLYRFVELRGTSHWIPDEAPDALAPLLLDMIGDGRSPS
ncbi:MAG TPA: alpha/beta fold hydrolase [Pseudonocardia sp.]|nr:alpha/beta fold hydrolase [Pseudonocardia sp.]